MACKKCQAFFVHFSAQNHLYKPSSLLHVLYILYFEACVVSRSAFILCNIQHGTIPRTIAPQSHICKKRPDWVLIYNKPPLCALLSHINLASKHIVIMYTHADCGLLFNSRECDFRNNVRQASQLFIKDSHPHTRTLMSLAISHSRPALLFFLPLLKAIK